MITRRALMLSAVPLTMAGSVRAALIAVTLYKNPECGCCEGYADYLRQHGFEVTSKPTNDLAEISQKAAIAPSSRITWWTDTYQSRRSRTYSPSIRQSKVSPCRECLRGLRACLVRRLDYSQSMPSARTANRASS